MRCCGEVIRAGERCAADEASAAGRGGAVAELAATWGAEAEESVSADAKTTLLGGSGSPNMAATKVSPASAPVASSSMAMVAATAPPNGPP
ncbi:hypothetical protein CCP2SC5_460022 [Azospirillaceae bacterium]